MSPLVPAHVLYGQWMRCSGFVAEERHVSTNKAHRHVWLIMLSFAREAIALASRLCPMAMRAVCHEDLALVGFSYLQRHSRRMHVTMLVSMFLSHSHLGIV